MKDQNERRQELVDKYLFLEMTEEERVAFEKQLETDEELKSLLASTKEFLETVDYVSKGKLTSEQIAIQKANEAIIRKAISKSDQKNRSKGLMTYLAVAATMAAIFIGIYNIYKPRIVNNNIYKAYFAPMTELLVTNTKDSIITNQLMGFYSAGKYKEYIQAVSSSKILDTSFTVESHQLASDLSVYLGISYMEIGDHEKAANILKQVDTGSTYYEDARWYYSLCLIKSNNSDSALNILSELSKGRNNYKNSATEIINKRPFK